MARPGPSSMVPRLLQKGWRAGREADEHLSILGLVTFSSSGPWFLIFSEV